LTYTKEQTETFFQPKYFSLNNVWLGCYFTAIITVFGLPAVLSTAILPH